MLDRLCPAVLLCHYAIRGVAMTDRPALRLGLGLEKHQGRDDPPNRERLGMTPPTENVSG